MMDKGGKRRRVKRRQPTMHDVARLAGVSQPTVSRVLNRSETTPRISEDTRERVLAAVKELDYRPNVLARGLRTHRTQTIALLVADLSNGFYYGMARAIQDVARQRDHEVLISYSDHLYENEKHFCDIVLRRAVDGVIISPIHLTPEDLDYFTVQTGTPCVVLGQHFYHPNIDIVYADDDKATYEATTWLIEACGYQSIGYLGVPDFYPQGPRRLNGFYRAMEEHHLLVNPSYVTKDGDFSIESGKQAAHTLIEMGHFPDAVLVCNDLMAIGLILTLQEEGYSIPHDIAVVGFDNIAEATIVRPSLTTIAQDPYDIGRKLVTALFERIETPHLLPDDQRRIESSTRLIRRQSAVAR